MIASYNHPSERRGGFKEMAVKDQIRILEEPEYSSQLFIKVDSSDGLTWKSLESRDGS